MDERLNGEVVKWFPQPRGYGFVVVPPSGERFFCHYSAVQGHQDLRVGDLVSFTLGTDKIGRVKAVDIALRNGDDAHT